MVELLQFAFVQRALIVGVLTALCCSLLGVFLVPRRFSMIGDGLAHFALAAVGFGLLANIQPLLLMIPLLMLASVFILDLPEKATLYGDAAIGMISVTGVALGAMMASMGRGFNVDLFSYLFGDILAISRTEMWVAILLSVVVTIAVVTLYHELTAITIDAGHGRVLGLKSRRIDRLLALLTALTVAIGIKTAGAMLLSSLLIFPAAAALQLARSFKGALLLSAGLGVASVLGGIAGAFYFDVPTGAGITLLNALIFTACWGLASIRRR